MFSKMSIIKSTKTYSQQIERLKAALETADAVVIGAGAGLSTSAGFVYTGERFEQYFSDFAQKYGFRDMYSGGFYPYSTPEEYWAYWSRYITVNRYTNPPKPVYQNLLKLIKDKDYFVLTTNVDHCFQKAGFDKKRLFYTQGDYGLFQCSEPCCQETFDNEGVIKAMMEQQQDMRIPSSLIPRCPHCGKPLTITSGQMIHLWKMKVGILPPNGIPISCAAMKMRLSCFWNWEWVTIRQSLSNIRFGE